MSEGESPQRPRPLEFTRQPQPAGPRPPAPRRLPRPELPLWVRWMLSIGVAAGLLIALVIYVNGHNTDAPQGLPISPKAVAEANREATILVQQDQAPRTVPAGAAATPAAGLQAAVAADMRRRIAQNGAAPPLRRAQCAPARTVGSRHGFSCTVQAGGVYYDFAGVLDEASQRITLCRHDPPPVPAKAVPVSRRCEA